MTEVPPAVTSNGSSPASNAADPILASDAAPIIARAGRYYRNMRYLVVIGLFVFAGFFAYDGFKRYPEMNQKIAEVNRAYDASTTDEDRAKLGQLQHQLGAPHTDTDIQLQKALAFVLPIAAIGYLIFVLYRSRGEIRLENDTLYVPGVAPVPLSAVAGVDDTLWKKKGIAVVTYASDGKSKSLRLDDFVYQQVPIDAIHDRLIAERA